MAKPSLNILILLWIVFLCSPFQAAREPTAAPPMELNPDAGLGDYLSLAAENNAGLKAAFEVWKAKLERIPQVKALPNPQLTFSHFIRQVETRVGPQRQKIGIMQMFPWFGKQKLRAGAALEAANSAKQSAENLKLNLFYRVKQAYYDYYLVHRTTGIIAENVRLLKYLEEVLLTKYRTGSAPYADLLKIQVELDRLRDRLAGTKDQLRPVKARLNAALNRPVNAPLPDPPKDIPAELPGIGYDRLVEQLKKNNPGLKAMDASAAVERFGIKLAKKSFYPDFSVGLDYVVTGDTSMPGVTDSGKDPVMAMVSVQLPIWGKKNKAAIREANARYNAALHRKTETENNLLTRLETVYFKFNDAKRKLTLYTKSLLPRAKQALEVSRSAFEAGKMDFINFIDSQRILLAFQLEWEQAKTQHLQRAAELEMLTGARHGRVL
ncbi:MAG: TolC family protein [bacterium]|nr:TolC family protein [bacterium]